jgi:hypothetical protein
MVRFQLKKLPDVFGRDLRHLILSDSLYPGHGLQCRENIGRIPLSKNLPAG